MPEFVRLEFNNSRSDFGRAGPSRDIATNAIGRPTVKSGKIANHESDARYNNLLDPDARIATSFGNQS